jgi:hypothetical protein
MEFLTILLSGVLGLVAPAGLVVDRIAENAIRSQLRKAEQLEVRVDNAPSYQVLQGKVERVRIAGRGLRLKQQDIRIAVLELETDPIDLEPRTLGQKQLKLRRAFSAGVHLVLDQQDINQALKLPTLAASLSKLEVPEIGNSDDSKESYNFVAPRVQLLANNRVRLQVELTAGNDKSLAITVESGLAVVAGRQIQLIEPSVYVNQEAVTKQLVSAIATDLNQKLDLGSLEVYGLKARILQLKVNSQKLEIVAFLRVEPSSRFLQNRWSQS